MTDKQKYIIAVIEANSEHKYADSGLTPYRFINRYMKVYEEYKTLQSIRYGMARLSGLSLPTEGYMGDNPMDYKN